jgi:TolB-like protein
VLAATLFALNVFRRREHVPGATEAWRIGYLAVLPLKNLSGDPAQEYFSDGLTDALITELAQLGSLRVISRTPSMQYKQTKKSLPAIARELNVDGIVEGTVQCSGDRVRITAQLIYGPTDNHLWANGYMRNMRDVFELEREAQREPSTFTTIGSGKCRSRRTVAAYRDNSVLTTQLPQRQYLRCGSGRRIPQLPIVGAVAVVQTFQIQPPLVTALSPGCVDSEDSFTIHGTGLYPSLIQTVLINGNAVDSHAITTVTDTQLNVIALDTIECHFGCPVEPGHQGNSGLLLRE